MTACQSGAGGCTREHLERFSSLSLTIYTHSSTKPITQKTGGKARLCRVTCRQNQGSDFTNGRQPELTWSLSVAFSVCRFLLPPYRTKKTCSSLAFLPLHQGLANSSWINSAHCLLLWIKFYQNTSLPIHSHSVCGCFHRTAAELNDGNRDRTYSVHKTEYIYSTAFYRKSFLYIAVWTDPNRRTFYVVPEQYPSRLFCKTLTPSVVLRNA